MISPAHPVAERIRFTEKNMYPDQEYLGGGCGGQKFPAEDRDDDRRRQERPTDGDRQRQEHRLPQRSRVERGDFRGIFGDPAGQPWKRGAQQKPGQQAHREHEA
jgi:hypothetical protein